jgi:hypothetical protein
MDEARKMDEARLDSERMRKQEAQRRRTIIAKEKRQSILDTPLEQWYAQHFPQSWILQDTSTRTTLETGTAISTTQEENAFKAALLDLLELENKARKWYGPVLPSAWFARICASQLVDAAMTNHHQSTTSILTTAIQSQLTALQSGMYSLDGTFFFFFLVLVFVCVCMRYMLF